MSEFFSTFNSQKVFPVKKEAVHKQPLLSFIFIYKLFNFAVIFL